MPPVDGDAEASGDGEGPIADEQTWRVQSPPRSRSRYLAGMTPAGTFARKLEVLSVEEQRRLLAHTTGDESLALDLPALISQRASAEWISEALERRHLLQDAGRVLGDLLASARSSLLERIGRRCSAMRYVLREPRELHIPLAEVYREPVLRFTNPVHPELLTSPAEADTREPRSVTRCEAPHPGTAQRRLVDWLSDRPRRERTLIVFGEVGAGKTELLRHAESTLLAQAISSPSAPIPLYVEVRKLRADGSLLDCIAERLGISSTKVADILDGSMGRVVLLIDGADEAHASVVTDALDALRLHEEHLEAIVIATRPIYRLPTIAGGVEARIEPWTKAEHDAFLDACAVREPGKVASVREALASRPLGLMSNPLLASMCLLIAAEEPDAMLSRSALMGAIVLRLQEPEQGRLTDSRYAKLDWANIGPAVRELAYRSLRENNGALTYQELRQVLRRRVPEIPGAAEDLLNAGLGLFVQVDGGYEFLLRSIAEFLAGQHLLDLDEADFLATARTPWGQEPVRHAVGWAQTHDPARACALMALLLRGEEAESPSVPYLRLRQVIAAGHIAADLGPFAPLPAVVASAIARRLANEYSTWIAAQIVEPARRIAEGGGQAFRAMVDQICDLLDPAAPSRASWLLALNDERQSWLTALLDRSPEVRITAIQKLAQHVDEPVVQQKLLIMLFDAGDYQMEHRVSLCAGRALRKARRDGPIRETLPYLQAVLRLGAQFPSCSAAMALLPDEAPLEALIDALAHGARGGAVCSDVLGQLAAAQGGAEKLEQRWPEWKRSLAESSKPLQIASASLSAGHAAPSSFVRSQLVRAIAPGLHHLRAEQVEPLLGDSDAVHSLTHEFDRIPEWLVDKLLDHRSGRVLCATAAAALSRRVEQDPSFGRYLVHRCEELLEQGKTGAHRLTLFPGRALESQVRRGDPAARSAYAAWLSMSSYADGHLGDYDNFPADILALPEVKVSLKAPITRAHAELGRSGPAALILRRFVVAWRDDSDLWRGIADRLCPQRALPLHDSVQWYEISCLLTCLERQEIPYYIEADLIRLMTRLLENHPDRDGDTVFFWHHYCHQLLAFITERRMEAEFRGPLLVLSGVEGNQACDVLQFHALGTAWPLLDSTTRSRMSHALSERLSDLTDLDEMPSRQIRGVIDSQPDAWERACLAHLENSAFQALPVHPATVMAIVTELPPPHQRRVLFRWLSLAQRWSLPWIHSDFRHMRLHRPFDEAWRLVFEAGLDSELLA